MIQKFSEVPNDTVFTVNGVKYQKVPQVKVSCCKSINAKAVDNSSQQVFILPNTEVEVNDQLQ